MIADALYLAHLKNKEGNCRKCKRSCPLRRFSWKVSKKSQLLPMSVLDLFGGCALVSHPSGSIIASVSIALSIVCQELELRLLYTDCRNPTTLAKFISKNWFKDYAGLPQRFTNDCAILAFSLLEVGISCHQWLDWLTVQLHTWQRCTSSFEVVRRISPIAITDEIYTYILAVLLRKDMQLTNDIVGPIIGLGDRARSLHRKRILSRYALVTLESGSQFLTTLLYSNPRSSAVIVDNDTGRIILSSSMAQEILWIAPVLFSHCNQELFRGMSNLLQYYFCVMSKADVAKSYSKLSAAINWETSSGRHRISRGLREEVFGQAGYDASQKLMQIEKLDSLSREGHPANEASISPLPFGHTFKDTLENPEQSCSLDKCIRDCGYGAMSMRQALLYRRWSLAVGALESAHYYRAPPRRRVVRRRATLAQRFAWKLGLHLLNVLFDKSKFESKVRAFLSHVLRRHWNIKKMDAFADVYLLLRMKYGEHEASHFAVTASAHVSDVVDEDRRSMALISAYETLFSYRNANRTLMDESVAHHSFMSATIPSVVTMRADMQSYLGLLRSGQLFLEALVDMYESSAGLVDLLKEYSVSWSCNLTILLLGTKRLNDREKRFFVKKLRKIKRRNLAMNNKVR